MIRARSTRFVGSVRDREISATVAAAPHQSAAQSLAAVLPLDPPIQSPALLLRHLVEISKLYPNILIFWNLCTSSRRYPGNKRRTPIHALDAYRVDRKSIDSGHRCGRSSALDPGRERTRPAGRARGRYPPTSRTDHQTVWRGNRRAARRRSPTAACSDPVERGENTPVGHVQSIVFEIEGPFCQLQSAWRCRYDGAGLLNQRADIKFIGCRPTLF